MDDPTKAGGLRVDFDEITGIFRRLIKPTSQVKTIQDFALLMQEATGKIFEKYESALYSPDDLKIVPTHILDCINNIMPSHLSFIAVIKEDKWLFVPKDKNAPKPPKPN